MSELDNLEEINIYPHRPAKMDRRSKGGTVNLKKMNSGHRHSPKWLRQLKHTGRKRK